MRFYLRDLLWACSELMRSPSIGGGITNQLALIRDLHTWAASHDAHVCLASFNYDFIAESACRAVRPPGIPALALPVNGKSELVWPSEQGEHFRSLQGRVSKFLVIGWRAVDRHFIDRMERLTRGAKALIVTGGPSADDEALQIQERLLGQVLDNTTAIKYVTKGFSALMNGRELPWLLAD